VRAVPNETADALELEEQAEEYPEDRGEILMEAAAAWRRAGDDLRARTLLDGLVEGGGEDGCYARVELVAQLLDDGRLDDALARLTDLARDSALHDGHCQWAAELLAEHGQHREALRWYDRLVARLAPERLDAVREADGWLAMESIALRGRREVRRELGLPPDSTDEMVKDPPEGASNALLGGLGRRTGHPAVARVLIFQRTERAEAHRRWPDVYDDDPQRPTGRWIGRRLGMLRAGAARRSSTRSAADAPASAEPGSVGVDGGVRRDILVLTAA
jgi:tetratricopeptide (TPR) repeat protein